MSPDTPSRRWEQRWKCFPEIIGSVTPLLAILGVFIYANRLAELGHSVEAISGAVAAMTAAVVYLVDRLVRQRPPRRGSRRR